MKKLRFRVYWDDDSEIVVAAKWVLESDTKQLVFYDETGTIVAIFNFKNIKGFKELRG